MAELKSLFIYVFISTMAVVLNGETLGGPTHGKAVVCNLALWSVYRPEPGMFTLEDLDPALCTHIVYSFAGLNETTNTIKSLDPYQDFEENSGRAGYKRIVALKERYPHLKVIIAVGGWTEGSLKYSNMASTAETRATFVRSVVNFLDTHRFDGLDLVWKYPVIPWRDGKPYDKANMVLLLKELKEAFKPRGYILTAATGAAKAIMEVAYDLPGISEHLDLIHIMAYDYHGPWDGFVAADSPLRGNRDGDELSVEYTIKYMIGHGVSPSKMVLGLPLYGRTYILKDAGVRDIEFGITPVELVGFQGHLTTEDGFMGYNEICMETSNQSSKWTYHWHDQSATPYLRDGERVISYDNTRAIATKVKMAIDYGLGGFMVWSIDTDDFRGRCDKETDTYKDFLDRSTKYVDNPGLNEALKELKLSDSNHLESLGIGSFYIISNGKLQLNLPQFKKSNFPIIQTINDATTLALEEKSIPYNLCKDIITKKYDYFFSTFVKQSILDWYSVICKDVVKDYFVHQGH